MSEFSQLWKKFAKSKKYREEFVAAQVKQGIPFQIRTLLKQIPLSQEELASRAGLTQGVISRAANPDYGNLTLNTIIRIAAGFDVAFVGEFVPFSELGRWFTGLSEASVRVSTFPEENEGFVKQGGLAFNPSQRVPPQSERSIGYLFGGGKRPENEKGGDIFKSIKVVDTDASWSKRLPQGQTLNAQSHAMGA